MTSIKSLRFRRSKKYECTFKRLSLILAVLMFSRALLLAFSILPQHHDEILSDLLSTPYNDGSVSKSWNVDRNVRARSKTGLSIPKGGPASVRGYHPHEDDSECPFKNYSIYRKVFVYPSVGDLEYTGSILSKYGRNGSVESWPWLRYDELARANATSHYDIHGQHVQYSTELLVRELMTNPRSCLRTHDPDNADLFWVPYLPSVEHHQGSKHINYKRTSIYAEAIRKILDEGEYEEWERRFGLTSRYWKQRNGSDHILVFSEPLHGLWHPSSKRGHFHYIHTQKQLSPPIVISVELSKSFVRDFPVCSQKNILLPYPNTNGLWFNGAYEKQASEILLRNRVNIVDSLAALPAEKELARANHNSGRPVATYYNAGNHGRCKKLRKSLSQQYKSCSLSARKLESLNLVSSDFGINMQLATFTICPGGDSPSAKRHFDAVLAGSIPVILSEDFVWPLTKDVDPQSVFNAEDFCIRLNASIFMYPVYDYKTCRLLNESFPSLDGILSSVTTKHLSQLRQGVSSMREHYSWYIRTSDLVENPLRHRILPDGGLAHHLVQALSERARGIRWPACEAELRLPRREEPTSFVC